MITDIRLQCFRSYKDAAFELSEGVNIIVGPNASGKTNLLEAILMLCRGSSYRAKHSEMVRFGRLWARLDAHTLSGGLRTVKINHSTNNTLKSFEIDNKPYSRLPLAKTLPTVLFEPQHLLLLTGRPDLRRDYVDDLLEQTHSGYGAVRRSYKRALYQRNRLLKRGRQLSAAQLFPWDIRVSELGGQLAVPRAQLASKLNKQISKLYQELSHSKTKVKLNYTSTVPIENYSSALLHKLETDSNLDYARGFTGHGPHRDDIEVLIGGHATQDIASRGEVRTILLALKILELQMLERLRGQKPLLLLDDVFSELDGARRRALTSHLKNYQTFITTTDADLVVQNFAQKCNIISIATN